MKEKAPANSGLNLKGQNNKPAPEKGDPESIAEQIQILVHNQNISIHSNDVPLELLGPMELARPGTLGEFAECYIERVRLENQLARNDDKRKDWVVLGIFSFLFALLALGFFALYKGQQAAGVAAILGSSAGLLTVLIRAVLSKPNDDTSPADGKQDSKNREKKK